MPESGLLADYPALARWYAERATSPPGIDAPSELLVWRTCEALAAEQANGIKRFVDGFNQFLGATRAALADFLAAEALTQRCDVALLDLMGDLSERAVRSEMASPFLGAMQAGADATGLVVLRFLSAWTALNAGRLDDCIAECDKVDEPFGSIYTLQGQALLELGNAQEACEVLNVAVKLAPSEILAWFQLAKAHHVLNRYEPAVAAVRECRRLAPQSDEVSLYLGMLALECDGDRSLAAEALAALKPALRRNAPSPMLIFTLLRLSTAASDKPSADQVLAEVDWNAVMNHKDAMRLIAPLLRDLHDAQWHDVAAVLLDRVIQRPAS